MSPGRASNSASATGTAGAGARHQRLAAQLQRSLVRLLRTGVKDPRVGNVTVTAVLLAADLSVATVYALPFGAPQDAAATGMLEGLRSAAGFLRGELSRELRLRHTPRLRFELDRQLDQAHHLTELIDRAVAADAARQGGVRRDDSTR